MSERTNGRTQGSVSRANGSNGRVHLSSPAAFPTEFGRFAIRALRDGRGREHALILRGDLHGRENVLVRVHSECVTSEALQSMRCDCRQQLHEALRQIGTAEAGALIYLRQEGRGIGLFNKIEAYALQDGGLDTVEANERLGFPVDSRTYEVAAEVLKLLGPVSVRLLTNNPRKIDALRRSGIVVSGRSPIRIQPDSHNDRYLETKRDKLNHLV